MKATPPHIPDLPSALPISRSHFLRGGLGFLAWSALSSQASANLHPLALRQPHHRARAKRVIMLTMKGAPSHVDTFDYKPELAARGGEPWRGGGGVFPPRLLPSPFGFAQHGESGLWISDLFPHLAEHADDLCVLNGMHTDLPNHSQAFLQYHTGSFQFVRPSMGAWTLYGLGSENQDLPGFISLNPPPNLGGARNYGSAFLPAVYQGTKIGGGQLPPIYAAFFGGRDEPGPPLRHLENPHRDRAAQRRQIDLIQELDSHKLGRDVFHPEVEGAIATSELAFRMQAEVPDVLDLGAEPESVRKLYGLDEEGEHTKFSTQCLMARRLSEAGVRFVEITAPVDWDHHFRLKDSLAGAAAATDRGIAALLTDLKGRGLLNDTLVIWGGEFGRTPYAQGLDGRDHNHKGFTVWMAGGGVKGGYTHGATDEFGYAAVEGKTHIHDLHATVLHLLGLDHTLLTFNYAGRDFRLTNVYGEVAHDVLA